MNRFDCDEIGSMDEYVGWQLKCDYYNKTLEFTQTVLLQRFEDEFDWPTGYILIKDKHYEGMSEKYQKVYRYIVGKFLHLVKWSIPEYLNSFIEISRLMGKKLMNI